MSNQYERVLPNFLWIGVMRWWSSWLYELLNTHPDIYLPNNKKEIHFFDRFYDTWVEYYKWFFPTKEESQKYKVIWEITPKYIYDYSVPEKIKNTIWDPKFILVLRDPVKRAISHFKLAFSSWNTNITSFSKYCDENPIAVDRWNYYSQLENYFQYFSQNNFLILIFEEIMANPEYALNEISDFLWVDKQSFNLPQWKVNESKVPIFRSFFNIWLKINYFFVKRDMNKIASIIQKMWTFYKNFFYYKDETTADLSIESEKISELYNYYEWEIKKLEKLLDKDLHKLWYYKNN